MDSKNIKRKDRSAYDAVMAHWDSIAKPIDGLGDLEHLIARIGGIQGTDKPVIARRTLIVFLSDNGIVREGVSQSESNVTHHVAESMARDESTVCVMSHRAGVGVLPVDIGMMGEPVPGIAYHRIREGTRSFASEPAMTEEESLRAIEVGRQMAAEACVYSDILLLGEMGIGNTSTATAVSCALLGMDPGEVCGRGAGLSSELLIHKTEVIKEALKRYDIPKSEVLRILCTYGGYDIAGMVGVILEASTRGMPVVMDGLITLSALLVAERMAPGAVDCSIASHFPREPMGQMILKELGLSAPIDAGIALGEGTGAVLLMPLLDVCMELFDHGTVFSGMDLEKYERYT